MTYLPSISDDNVDKLRPEVFQHWKELVTSIRSKMKLRRYELIAFSASQALECKT